VWERRSWRPCRFGLGPLVHVGAGGVAQYRMDVVAQPGRGRSSVARAGTNARGAQQFQAVECSDIFGRTDGNFSSSRPVRISSGIHVVRFTPKWEPVKGHATYGFLGLMGTSIGARSKATPGSPKGPSRVLDGGRPSPTRLTAQPGGDCSTRPGAPAGAAAAD